MPRIPDKCQVEHCTAEVVSAHPWRKNGPFDERPHCKRGHMQTKDRYPWPHPTPITDAGQSLKNAIACHSRDWSTHPRDAWIFGIVCGWDGDSDSDCFSSLQKEHGWIDEAVVRLKRLHVQFNERFPRFWEPREPDQAAESEVPFKETEAWGMYEADELLDSGLITEDEAEALRAAARILTRVAKG